MTNLPPVSTLVRRIEGIVLLVMASLALPALMRFVVPMVAAAGGVGSAAVVGGAAGVAVGAAMIAGTGGTAAAARGAGSSPAGLIPKGGPRGPDGAASTKAPARAGQAQAAGQAVHRAATKVADTVEKVADGASASSNRGAS